MSIIINNRKIGKNHPTYFIADIAANHDGSLERAKDLLSIAKENGANAAKFQHFKAETIVSDYGFKTLKSKLSHQKNWEKSVFEIYKDASINLEWTKELFNHCKKVDIDFLKGKADIAVIGTQTIRIMEEEGIASVGNFVRGLR